MSKLYLNVIWKSESDDYIVVRSRMSSMKWEFYKIYKERSRRERHTTRKPSAHQARTGSLVRRNLKYDEDWKNYCQSNVGDVLRIHVNKDIYFVHQDSILFSFLRYYFSSFRISTTLDSTQAYCISRRWQRLGIAHLAVQRTAACFGPSGYQRTWCSARSILEYFTSKA